MTITLRLLLLVAFLFAPSAHATGLSQIRLFGYDQRAGQVVLYSNTPLTINGFHLLSPERWVVDVPNATYSGAKVTLPAIAGTPVRGVRIGQFQTDTVRIVFDLDRRMEFPQELSATGAHSYKLAFKVGPPDLARSPMPTPRPRAAVGPASPGLALHHARRGWELTITTQRPFVYAMPQKPRASRLALDLKGAGSELPKDSLYVDNGLIARVRVVPLSQRTNRVILEFDQPIRYTVRQSDDKRTLTISLGGAAEEQAPRQNPTERRVTIDAGHGGMDSGTIGVHGTLEKDVTLQMALRLQKLMQDSGMEVQMTRTKDMQIMLHPRVDIGDSFDSDVFISIHANHIGDPRVAGIETYYFTPKSLPLARSVHRRLISTLQRPDRGIRRNNFVVVKYNKMPACLVEIGYLSNPGEERLLTSPRYQQKAAEAILAGVQDYFKTRSLRQ